jgi:hydrogenase maturation protein HypF
MCLEGCIGNIQTDEAYAFTSVNGIADFASLVQDVKSDRVNGIALSLISAKFHNALADWIVTVAQTAALQNVVLSGGVFQNAYLTRRSRRLLEAEGFAVFTHRNVPTNDGGLALGQAVLAGMIH